MSIDLDFGVARLQKLKEMLDLGLISQEEYDQKKAEILGEL
ncbi:MAG: SHOCT domain-containing protein [Candidatus Thorarchaeota archaeon]